MNKTTKELPKTLRELKPAGYNSRKISRRSFAGLKSSLEELGDIAGFTFNRRTGNLIAGHQRRMALIESFGEDVPIVNVHQVKEDEWFGELHLPDGTVFPIRIVDWDERKEKIANLTANNPEIQGDFILATTEKLLADLATEGALDFELGALQKSIEADMAQAQKALTKDVNAKELPVEPSNDPGANFKSIYGYNPAVFFPSTNRYGIPDLREDMFSDRIPETTWSGRTELVDPAKQFFLFGSMGINKWPKEAAEGTLCFHTEDDIFERTYNDAEGFADWIKGFGWKAVAGPDFSHWRDWPIALQILATYKNRWISRFWQEAGIKVMPCISWSHEGSYDFAFCGIPHGCPVLEFQCRNSKADATSRKYTMQGIRECMLRIDPGHIVIYGGHEHRRWLEPALEQVRGDSKARVHYVASWTNQRNKAKGW